MPQAAAIQPSGSHSGPAGRTPRVVIVGAGFGGLYAAKRLRGAPVDVLVLDRRNYHAFVPLLYEVATAGLDAGDIAQPVRAILRAPNIRFRMAEVQRIDLPARTVHTDRGDVTYDYLIIAAGSTTNDFGLPSVEANALQLKDLPQAIAVRRHIIESFESASLSADPDERRRLMTTVVVGGGPTGVETSGALAELKRHVLPHDYPELDLSEARVILLEATDHLLAAFPAKLQRSAVRQLTELGVEVRLNTAVAEITRDAVVLKTGEQLPAASVIWVAGVRAEDIASSIDAEFGPGHRVKVAPTLQLPAHPEVYAIGDLSYIEDARGRANPMLASSAIQQANIAASNILRRLRGQAPKHFRYVDRGTMATIGRQRAVAHVFGLQFDGFLAWFLWLSVHLIELIGLRNRARVLMTWIWNYARYDKVNRLVTAEDHHHPGAEDSQMSER